MINTYLCQREISGHLTDLARQLAIREAELVNRERGLIAPPAPVEPAQPPRLSTRSHASTEASSGSASR